MGIGVGLESGLVVVDGVHFDFCACDIYDGTRHWVGMSSMFALPPRVVETLETKGYNDSFKALGVTPDPNGDGVLGYLSGGILSRPAQMMQSVHSAMLQMQ